MTRFLLVLCLLVPGVPTREAFAAEGETTAGAWAASVERVRQKLLRTHKPPGAPHLKLEMEQDPRIRNYVGIHGQPELMFVEDRWRVRLVYLGEDRMVTFVRKSEERKAQVKGHDHIPKRYVKKLTFAEQERLRDFRLAGLDLPPPAARVGTCFAVHPDGLLLTANHILKGKKEIAVELADGTRLPARIERRSDALDLALLRVDSATPNFLSISEQVRLGDRVFTIGFPATDLLGTSPKYSEGIISGLEAGPEQANMVLTSVPTQAGNSGGPLVNERGQVIGVLLAIASHERFMRTTGWRPQNVNFAGRIDGVLDWFSAPPQQAPPDGRAATIDRTRQAVCRIEVKL